MSLKKKIMHSPRGVLLVNYLHEIEGSVLPKMINDDRAVRRYCKKVFHRNVDIDDPVLFYEKLNWYKLHGRDPLMEVCANKYTMRDYVSGKGYAENLNQLLGVYTDVDDIDIDALPDSFVLKASHGTHMQIIVKNKSDVDWAYSKKLMRSWLRQDIYWRGREWVYKDMPRHIIVERYLEDKNGELRDYKFFCFHGKPYYMQYDIGRFCEKHYRNYYDLNGTVLDIDDGTPNLLSASFPLENDTFLEMQNMASVLSEPFQQVRVDFYCCNQKIYIGEMTFFDGGGATFFSPDEWNYKFSENWIINN